MSEQDGRYEVWETLGRYKRSLLKLAVYVGDLEKRIEAQEQRVAELEKALAEAKALPQAA